MESALQHFPLQGRLPREKKAGKYYSVEIFIDNHAYQFKIWNMISMPMCILVKENSKVLPQLQVGDTMDMKYYQSDTAHPTDKLTTEIRHISKRERGRFRGHYFVELELLDGVS
jgi:hypothetical protein